jgi:hypothetical protein
MLFICTDLHQLNTYFFEEVEFVSKFFFAEIELYFLIFSFVETELAAN